MVLVSLKIILLGWEKKILRVAKYLWSLVYIYIYIYNPLTHGIL